MELERMTGPGVVDRDPGTGGKTRRNRLIGVVIVAIMVLVTLFLVGIGLIWVLASGANDTPRMIFRPMPKESGSSLIWINRNKDKSDSPYSRDLASFFENQFGSTDGGGDFINCAYGGNSSNDLQACRLEVTNLNKGCSKENANFGYEGDEGRPCVLVQLEKNYDWVPEPYKTNEDLELARERGMPEVLFQKIKKMINMKTADPMLDTIWITCDGENLADLENIGPLSYYSPAFLNEEFQGIPAYYFPYKNQQGYKTPFVFVKFLKPRYNVLFQVTCKAWAKNIESNRTDTPSSVHFELMID